MSQVSALLGAPRFPFFHGASVHAGVFASDAKKRRSYGGNLDTHVTIVQERLEFIGGGAGSKKR